MKRSTAVLCFTIAVAFAGGDEITIHKSPELSFRLPVQGDRLLSQYRGKVVALEFILTTCPHCQAASQVMNKMQERYSRRGFQALDVAIDPSADLKVENFAKEHHVNFEVGWTTLEQMMTYMGFTDRPVVPQLVMIDRDGNIHYATPRQGDGESMKEEVIEKRIEELLDRGSRTRASQR
jgi:peroxiredoxin